MQPDPKTGRLVRQWLHGYVTEAASMTVTSYAYTIKRGNSFATGQ
jgi:hypothetical protein